MPVCQDRWKPMGSDVPRPLGFDVEVWFRLGAPFKDRIFHNATEVYHRRLKGRPVVAIESDIHGAKAEHSMATIAMLKVTPATELAEEF